MAEVQLGNAVRYGSVTYNGEKEVVGGIVMMLKGANSAAVVERVKEKMRTLKNHYRMMLKLKLTSTEPDL